MVLVKSMFKSWNKFIKEVVDTSSIKVHRELNQKFWEGESAELNSEIRENLLEIVRDFMGSSESLDVPFEDITFTGSLANFNYSKYSDIDLHIVVNFSDVNEDVEMVKEYFNSKKALWNYLHEILIKGYEVEIYVQDVNEKHISSGVYSVLNNKWINKPKFKEAEIDRENIKKKATSLADQITRAAKLYDEEKYEEALERAEILREKIQKFRKAGLAKNGEFSIENLSFKTLRTGKYLKKLSNLKRNAYDKIMSIKENT